MRSGAIRIGASLPGCSALQPGADEAHDVLDLRDWFLREADDVHVLLRVLPADHLLATVQQIVQLTAVDLVEGEVNFQVFVLLKQLDHVVSGQKI